MSKFCRFVWWPTECSQGYLSDHGFKANHWILLCSRVEHSWRQWFPLSYRLSVVNSSAVRLRIHEPFLHLWLIPGMLVQTQCKYTQWVCCEFVIAMAKSCLDDGSFDSGFLSLVWRYSMFILVTSYIGSSFILLVTIIPFYIICTKACLSIEGHVCCRQFRALVNEAPKYFKCRAFIFFTCLIFISVL